MARLEAQFSGFGEVIRRLNQLEKNIKPIANAALMETQKIVTAKVEAATVKANYPRKGKYSHNDRTRKAIVETPIITWTETQGSVKVGYYVRKSWESIFLLYGSPYYKPVQPMYEAIFGEQTEGEILAAQKEIFYNALEKLS